MSSKYRIIPLGGGGITPEGTLNIRSEGVFDVTDYASVDVDIFDDTTTKTITNNGTYNASDDNVLGYSQVTVDVPASAVDSGTLTIEPITQNVNLFTQDVTGYRAIAFEVAVPASEVDTGTKQITTNGNGQDVVGYAAVDVNVPNGTETITITQNGVYYPTSPNVGFSEVVVNVGGSNPDYFWVKSREAGQEVGFYRTASSISWPNIEYSFDKTNWTTLQGGSSAVIPNSGQKLYMRGNNPLGLNKEFSETTFPYMFVQISVNGSNTNQFDAGGNMMTLLYKEADVRIAPAYSFFGFFHMDQLVDASELTIGAETVGKEAFYQAFAFCTEMTTPPVIPAEYLDKRCFAEMFNGCSSLTSAPALHALSVPSGAYLNMFGLCTSLTTAPNLPARQISSYSYSGMFSGCTSLTQAPAILPAMELAEFCYSNMFHGCTSLTQAPALPATTLAECCYQQMFCGEQDEYGRFISGTGAAITAITLPATTLYNACYDLMFGGCSSLREISISYAGQDWMNTSDPNCINANYSGNWTEAVSVNGVFKNLGNAVIPTNDPSHTCDGNPDPFYGGIPQGWTVQTVDYFWVKNEDSSTNTISVLTPSEAMLSTDLEYSTDASTWTAFDLTQRGTSIQLSAGEKMYMRSTTGYHKVNSSVYSSAITSTGNISTGGNLLTLINYTSQNPTPAAGSFDRMFMNNTHLVDASSLYSGITVLPNGIFKQMFVDCSALVYPMQMSGITIINWNSCYRMYAGCTALTTPPDMSSVEKLYGGQYMFYRCSSLTVSPDLRHVTDASSEGVSSIPSIFADCSSLATVYAPNIPNWTQYQNSSNWLSGVAATGTIYVPTGSNMPNDSVNGVPSGWTRVDY